MADKQKQIEEMAEFLHVESSFAGYEEDAVRLAEELYNAGYRKQTEEGVAKVVRCFDCAVPHNEWTGCPNLNGLIPPPDFYCARGERKIRKEEVCETNTE